MCGRFTLTVDKDELSDRFGCPVIVPDYRPRYNAAPTQMMPVVLNNAGKKHMQMMKWGLIPHWTKDPKLGNKLFNARVETVAEKPAFRDCLYKRRCIIPADGYYEWMKINAVKTPLRIILKSRELFGFAGLWDKWTDAQGQEQFNFTILTTEPIDSLHYIHNRMPLILRREDESNWLKEMERLSAFEMSSFINTFKPEETLTAYPVTSLVNSSSYDSPELIEAASDCLQE